MGWGELDRPGSTCLERTQTHRTGLSGKEFKRAGRKGEKKAHIADASEVSYPWGQTTPQGMQWDIQKQRWHAFQRLGSPSTIKEVGLGRQPPTSSLSPPPKQLWLNPPWPQQGKTLWGKATLLELPHSLLPQTGQLLPERASCCHPQTPPTKPWRRAPCDNAVKATSKWSQTLEGPSDTQDPSDSWTPQILTG